MLSYAMLCYAMHDSINFNSTSPATNKIHIPCRLHACCRLVAYCLLPSVASSTKYYYSEMEVNST